MVLAPFDEIDRRVPKRIPIKMPPGRVLVAMHDIEGKIGSVSVPKIGRLGSGKFGARVGVVWAVGGPDLHRTDGEPIECELQVGDVVGVRPYRGHWYEAGTEIGGLVVDRQIRILGANDYWYEEIPFRFEGEAVLPTYDWTVVQRDVRYRSGLQVVKSESEPPTWRDQYAALTDAIEKFLEDGDPARVFELANPEVEETYREVYDAMRRDGYSEVEAKEQSVNRGMAKLHGPRQSEHELVERASRYTDGEGTVVAAGPLSFWSLGRRFRYSHARTVPEYAPLVFMRGEDDSRVMVRAGCLLAELT